MILEDAIKDCHVRSAVRRKKHPNVKFWKNHTELIIDRVPKEWLDKKDWEEYDPREDDDCSLFMYND